MIPVDKFRQKRGRSLGGRTGLLLPAIALMALAGCEGDYGAKQGDPFVGIHAPPAPSTGAATTQTASTATPLPASHTSPPLGAVASGTTGTPQDPRNLRIDTQQVVPVSGPGGGAARGTAPADTMLQAPEPLPDNTAYHRTPISTPSGGFQQTAASSASVAAPPGPASGTMTYEQAQQYLKQHGVVWQRLETVGDQGQWRFRCSLPDPNHPRINHTYETIAPLPNDPITAVRAVLSQIEQGQH